MKSSRFWILGCWLLLGAANLAWAQPLVPIPAEALSGAGTVPLTSIDGSNAPLFLNSSASNMPGLSSQATVAGRGASNVGNVQIGFDYVRPYWTSRDFTLAVPAANAGSFPLLGNTGHVDDHFALVPNVKYKYDVQDLDLAFKASGTFLNLSGHLEQKLSDTNTGVGVLTASSSLTIITANLPEVSTRVFYDDLFAKHPHMQWSIFNDLVIDIGVGTRYTSVNQNYTGQLTNSVAGGSNSTTRYSTQSFKGIGLTTSMNFSLPVLQDWVVFTNLRGSVLVGDNARESTLTVNVLGKPGITSAISQARTEFMPVLEMEMGTEWGMEIGERLRQNAPPPLCTVRVAGAAQYWGGVGPLSAGSSQGFRTSNLFLVGAHIMVGIHR